MTGKPGTGKSTLSRFFVDCIRGDATCTPRRAIVAAISFDFRHVLERERGNTKGLLFRALLYQILEGDPSILSDVSDSLKLASPFLEHLEHPDDRYYERCLKSAIAVATNKTTVFIAIDGLDECDLDVQADMMACIRTIYDVTHLPSKVRVMVSSRWTPTIQQIHEEYGVKKIDLEMENSQDIATFCSAMLKSKLAEPGLIINDDGATVWNDLRRPIQRLVDVIRHRADGMFLWVQLAINALVTEFPVHHTPILSAEKWQKAVYGLPSGLNSLYEALINRVSSEFKLTFRYLFSWCIFATRPLTVDELGTALQYNTPNVGNAGRGTSYINWTSRLDQVGQGLIEIVNDPLSNTQCVRLVHWTVKEYLTGLGARHVIPTGHAHTLLSEKCVQSMHASLPRQSAARNPLLNYSMSNWSYHAALGDKAAISQDYLVGFFQRPVEDCVFLCPSYSCALKPDVSHFKSGGRFSVLHCASRYGLLNTLRELLVRQSTSTLRNQTDHIGRTALHYACASGHADVVQTLLNSGSHVDATDYDKCTPLHLAVYYRHEKVARILLDRGASVNSTDGHQTTALYRAVKRGTADMVKKLLLSGADSNYLGPNVHSMLSLATVSSNEDVAKLALELESTKNSSSYSGIALAFAAALGLAGLVRTLLIFRGSADACDPFLQQAFIAAIFSNYEEIVFIFLEFGCHPDVYDYRHGQSALSIAAAGGREHLVGTLLRHGADPNLRDLQYGKTPVMHAITHGYPAVVRLLVEQGASIELPKRPCTLAEDGWIFRIVSSLVKQCPNGSKGSGNAQKPRDSSNESVVGSPVRRKTPKRSSGQGRKRTRSKRTPDDNEGDSEDESESRKRVCKGATPRYACPYQKRFPDQHKCLPKTTVTRVK